MLAITLPVAAQSKLQMLWLGQAAFKITTPGGKVIVVGPWLTINPNLLAAAKRSAPRR